MNAYQILKASGFDMTKVELIPDEDTDREFMPDEADNPQIFDLDTDAMGNCFSDADPGL